MKRWPSFALVLGFLVSAPLTSQARPPHKRALADYFGPFLERKLNDCRTCHLSPVSGDTNTSLEDGDKPHNPFGARLKDVRAELKNAGKKTAIASRIEAVGQEDSDGDGAANLLELITGHNPGEKEDKPSAEETVASSKKLAEFQKYLSAYPWTPFDALKRPAVPVVKNAAWVRNPIDAFVAAEHEARGLRPRPEAAKHILLRRVYLDLIGLPPTQDELHAFLDDASPDAYEKVVDKLLASSQYGERWGRHWMDVWRYSDWAGWTDGGQIRDSQPHIWRWRDWIIESLNKDKGYDRMVLEMLAADELCSEDTNALRATGFLVRNYKMLSREKWLQDTVEHTFLAFQAVTINCAKCHDHMFDPIYQKEYYRVRAIFEPHQVRLDRVPGQLDTKLDGLPRVYDGDLSAKTFLLVRGDDRNPDKDHPIEAGVPEVLGGQFAKIDPIVLPTTSYAPDHRDFVIHETLAASQVAEEKARKAYETAKHQASSALRALSEGASRSQQQIDQEGALTSASELAKQSDAVQKALDALAVARLDFLVAEKKRDALQAAVEAEHLEDSGKKDSLTWKDRATKAARGQREVAAWEAEKTLLSLRKQQKQLTGEAAKPLTARIDEANKALQAAQQKLSEPPSTDYKKREAKTYPKTSTGRRLAFARWLTDRQNPLTARVAVNHMWLRHFGQAIVPNVFDFGRNGRLPSHPALLDWLAGEFMERKWSMKQLHRLIVTSNAYRMASTPDQANLIIDQDNKYLWRMNSRRMEAEVVRDGIFYIAGQLDLKMGGPEIDCKEGLSTPRRSIYFRHAAEKQMEFLKIFDAAGVTECYQRKESVMPQQALALANSELTLKHARLLAKSISDRIGPDAAAFAQAAFEQVLSRSPTRDELIECVSFLAQQSQTYGSGSSSQANPQLRARENLVHVLMNHNDFVTIR